MTWVPDDECIELVFDKQDHYEPIALELLKRASEFYRAKNGKPKLVKWGYIARDATILTQPADFYAYALAQHYKNPRSSRAQWCLPILSGRNLNPIGKILTKDEIREEISETLAQIESDFPNYFPIPLRWKQHV